VKTPLPQKIRAQRLRLACAAIFCGFFALAVTLAALAVFWFG